LDANERVGESFTFRVDREFKAILALEALDTLSMRLVPEIVLINYMYIVLGSTFFEIMVVIASSLIAGAVIATYLSERIEPIHRFKVISLNYLLTATWALIMFLNPGFIMIVAAYSIMEFGRTLAFPFYRSWIFSKIPQERASSLLAAISSYNRMIATISPLVAAVLAAMAPTLPYLVSLLLYLMTVPILLSQQRRLYT
jgi:hypothetical protein